MKYEKLNKLIKLLAQKEKDQEDYLTYQDLEDIYNIGFSNTYVRPKENIDIKDLVKMSLDLLPFDECFDIVKNNTIDLFYFHSLNLSYELEDYFDFERFIEHYYYDEGFSLVDDLDEDFLLIENLWL